ncbi:MAG: glycosyltransferase family 1 protein [Roseburia sp.]|nr:glycosyltransferase family 1 protein [Roseburia sp.]
MSHRYHTNQTTIMKGWIENGHEVRFISQYAGRVEDYTYVEPDIIGYSGLFRVFDYLYVNIFRKNDPAAVDMKLKCGFPPMIKLAGYIRAFRPDVAILRERSLYTICMNALCKHYKIPAILYNQTPLWEKAKELNAAHKLVWRLTPECRITPVEAIGIDHTGLVRDKNAYLTPFLMEPQVSPREKTYFADGRINIFCIGKYQKRKNLQMMIEAVEELLCGYPLHLVIAGEMSNRFHEEYYEKVSTYVKEHKLESAVTLLTNLDKAAVEKQYRRADLFVLPSTGEPAAVSHLEAMAFSLPAISGSNNGTAGYIKDGITGYVFKDNDKEDLKEKIKKIIEDKEVLVRMGAAAYQHVKEDFQFETYYEQVEKILKRYKEERKGGVKNAGKDVL